MSPLENIAKTRFNAVAALLSIMFNIAYTEQYCGDMVLFASSCWCQHSSTVAIKYRTGGSNPRHTAV